MSELKKILDKCGISKIGDTTGIFVEVENLLKEKDQLLAVKDKKIQTLEAKVKEYESGHKGACFTCEPVGELNQKLEAHLIEACEVIDEYDDWMIEDIEFEKAKVFLNKLFIKNLLNKEGGLI